MTELQWMRIFGNNLADIMEEAGYNQKQLAIETGISETSISRYVNGTQMPSMKALVNIASILMCDINELVCVEDMID